MKFRPFSTLGRPIKHRSRPIELPPPNLTPRLDVTTSRPVTLPRVKWLERPDP